ncbi:hypothetical protein L2E82_18162 [Cichorium intybus]|uniref:Uncharacterized protein n=1 Tax=Cichorium intybus TaxID=13427 RepID=A0ACB9FAE4_CICIN|nr:hypothetical protein L2E82_18162 [Cichorium intybus]
MASNQLKEISEKLDLLLQSKANPSISDWQSQLDAHKDSVDTLITENVKLMHEFSSLIDKSETQMQNSANSIGRLEKDILKFTQDFRDSHVRNNEKMQQVISNFGSILKKEKQELSTLRSKMKTEYAEWSAILTSAVSQSKAVRNGVSEIDSFLHRMVEDTDPILTPQDTPNKDNPIKTTFTTIGKENEKGATQATQNPDSDWFKRMNAEGDVGPSSADPSKRKGKEILEEQVFDQDAAKEARDKEIDEILNLTRKLDAEEAAKREVELLLKTKMSLFPPWNYKRMTLEAITEPVENWLQPVTSYNTSNDVNSQLDFPMTAKALLFRGFEELKDTRLSNPEVNDLLFTFYLKNAFAQHLTWSLKKIVKLTPRLPEVNVPFRNTRFLAIRGDDKEKMEFSLADLPLMNPFDWISLFNILSREQNYHPLSDHLKRMIGYYILEVTKLDVEVAAVLDKIPLTVRRPPPKNLSRRKIGKIVNSNWSVAYNSKEGLENIKRIFYLSDKHLHRTPVLEHILHITNKLQSNTADHKTCINDMLGWYIEFRKRILAMIPKVFDRQANEVKPEE